MSNNLNLENINLEDKNLNLKDVRAIQNNLREFLTCLKNLSTSEYCNLNNSGHEENKNKYKYKYGNFCVSTRSESASENWVFYDEPVITTEAVSHAKKFFDERDLKFIWPVLNPDLNFSSNQDVLRECGLNYAGDLLGMSLDVKSFAVNENYYNNRIFFYQSCADDGAVSWADTAWLGFGGLTPAPENFRDFACAVIREKNLHQVKCAINTNDNKNKNKNKEYIGTYLTCDDDFSNTGVYYFAVPPKFRRNKVAHDMMMSIAVSAHAHEKNKIVLQSTPAGVPFYKNFGFETVCKIPVFTNTDDFEDVF